MSFRKINRTNLIDGSPDVGGLVDDHLKVLPRSTQDRYRDVALIAAGKAKHRRAAFERAAWLAEKDEINVTPLDRATENVWRARYDLVITGFKERRAIRHMFRRNDVINIVRHSPSDVLVVRHRPVAPSRRIVVAIDPDLMDASRMLLASESVDAAVTFADWNGSELHVVNVIRSFKYYVLAMNAGLKAIDAIRLEAEARSAQRHNMHQFLYGLNIDRDRMKVHLLRGDPVRKIANLVFRLDADLLVIGSAARKGISRWLIGNMAEEVMRQVACSCLVVKTSGSSSRQTG